MRGFKKWLEDIGSRPTGAEYGTAGEFPTAGLVSGAGHGSGGFDGYGQEYRLPRLRRSRKRPLGELGSKVVPDPRPPRDRLELSRL